MKQRTFLHNGKLSNRGEKKTFMVLTLISKLPLPKGTSQQYPTTSIQTLHLMKKGHATRLLHDLE